MSPPSSLVLRFVLPLLLLSSACSAAELTARDIEGAAQGAEAVAQAPDDKAFSMTLQVLSMVEMNRSSSCLKALSAAVEANPESFSRMSWGAWEACGGGCPKSIDSYGALAPAERVAGLISECDARGPDPLFTGALADLRKDFLFPDYLLLRLQADHLVQAVENTGTPEAQAVLKSYRDQAGRIAADMKKRGDLERALQAEFEKESPPE